MKNFKIFENFWRHKKNFPEKNSYIFFNEFQIWPHQIEALSYNLDAPLALCKAKGGCYALSYIVCWKFYAGQKKKIIFEISLQLSGDQNKMNLEFETINSDEIC